jgi:hypothetical protein
MVFVNQVGRLSAMRNSQEIRESFLACDRTTQWQLEDSISFKFPTYHPQGLVVTENYVFLSSVEVNEPPQNVFDPNKSTPGSGVGHLFIADRSGALIKDLIIGEGSMYHPGGIDFDGEDIWIPVGEYRPHARSMVVAVNAFDFSIREVFRINDSIGWAVPDPEKSLIYGGNWGSRVLYVWNQKGEEIEQWKNPSHFVDYQDAIFLNSGEVIASGISVLLSNEDAEKQMAPELGGLALLDFKTKKIVHEIPIYSHTKAGHVLTRNPFSLSVTGEDLFLHVAPDDGDDLGGTSLNTYKAVRR